MTPDYKTMLTALGQVCVSAAVAYVDAAARFAGSAVAAGGSLASTAAEVIQAPSDQRQAALERAIGTGYRGYVDVVRVAGALPSRSTLVFLNELDRMRGPKMPPKPDEPF
jgi:hypothetical protein